MLGSMGCAVCSYEGQPHLCFAHYVLDNPIHNDIMNASYDVVRSVFPPGSSGGHPLEPDLHEFNLIDGTPRSAESDLRPNLHDQPTAIISSSVTRQLPRPFHFDHCNRSIDWVQSSVFQEVTLDGTDTLLYQWDSYDHVALQDSVNCPGHDDVWMEGTSDGSPFDHFHLNAVDKDRHGDYYLSARHTSTLYKVSGNDGAVLWQLGARHDDFEKSSEVPDIGVDFAFQHDLRVQHDYPGADLDNGIIVLSLFDNANDDYDGAGRIADFSAGKVIVVDERARTAVLKEAYTLFLDRKHQLATNQGSFQLLPNGNRILGGGSIQQVIEWQPNNPDPVFRAHWGDWELPGGEVGHMINSYRSMRFMWQGQPRERPALFAYAADCGARAALYASWNGATAVATWEFWGAAAEAGPFQILGAAPRTAFESRGSTPYANYIYAVARDAQAAELGRSATHPVHVLDDADEIARSQCDAFRCPKYFDYTARASRACPPADLAAALAMPPVAPEEPVQHHFGKHCDPCFGPYQRFIA